MQVRDNPTLSSLFIFLARRTSVPGSEGPAIVARLEHLRTVAGAWVDRERAMLDELHA